MGRKITLVGIAIMVVIFSTTTAMAGDQTTTVHVIIDCQDQDTELEITVDGKWRGRDILDKGRTVYAFKTGDNPAVEILAYGDTLKPELTQGRSGDWYGVVDIKRPRDGDGGVE